MSVRFPIIKNISNDLDEMDKLKMIMESRREYLFSFNFSNKLFDSKMVYYKYYTNESKASYLDRINIYFTKEDDSNEGKIDVDIDIYIDDNKGSGDECDISVEYKEYKGYENKKHFKEYIKLDKFVVTQLLTIPGNLYYDIINGKFEKLLFNIFDQSKIVRKNNGIYYY